MCLVNQILSRSLSAISVLSMLKYNAFGDFAGVISCLKQSIELAWWTMEVSRRKSTIIYQLIFDYVRSLFRRDYTSVRGVISLKP